MLYFDISSLLKLFIMHNLYFCFNIEIDFFNIYKYNAFIDCMMSHLHTIKIIKITAIDSKGMEVNQYE